ECGTTASTHRAACSTGRLRVQEHTRPADRPAEFLQNLLRGSAGDRHSHPRPLATKDTYVSTALTRGVNLAWLSEQTGVSDATLRRHYGKFIHADAADALELSKIGSRGLELAKFAPPLPLRRVSKPKKPLVYKGNLVEQKGFEPSTPTL